MKTVAAFDFDGTLLQGDCLLLFHQLLRGRGGMLVGLFRLLPALVLWKSGLRCTAWFKQRYLREIISGSDPQTLKNLLEQKLPQLLLQRLRPDAVARLRWHEQQGHTLVIISASPRALIQPVAQHLHASLIATETSNLVSERAPNSPMLTSKNCKGAEKVVRLEAWLGQPHQDIELHAYGDSKGDRELLQVADYPHWRGFSSVATPYPAGQDIPKPPGMGWVPLLGLTLLALAAFGLMRLEPATRQVLIQGIQRLPAWLPSIYAVLGVAYLGRYWRWRILLGAAGIGQWCKDDLSGWFHGFTLTATPGKFGELSRVNGLHNNLGYPRAPLVHAFVAERLCDLVAVGLWLVLLVPAQLQYKLSSLNSGTSQGIALIAGFTGVVGFGSIARWFHNRWKHHLPSGAMAVSCLPATAVSLGIWGCESIILWLLVQALSPDRTISLSQSISTYLLSGTAGMLSSLPGGIGVNEGAATLLLSQAGVPTTLAFAIAIFRRICTVWSITGLAIGLRLVTLNAQKSQEIQ